MSVVVNKTLWTFPSLAVDAVALYLGQHIDSDVTIIAAPSPGEIATPSIAIRHASIDPYTTDAAIIAHIHTRTVMTLRTAATAENRNYARELHESYLGQIMGAIVIADTTTKENALHTELNSVAPAGVTFSEARWTGNANGIDDENNHIVTTVEIETIISPTVVP
jgi:hypothetical protein